MYGWVKPTLEEMKKVDALSRDNEILIEALYKYQKTHLEAKGLLAYSSLAMHTFHIEISLSQFNSS
jgi:hypothetical protein